MQEPKPADGASPLLEYHPTPAKANGKHVVLIAGDEEYRSEEALPMLGRILARHHGFRCTVLFSLDAESGAIDPMNQTNIPGTEVLDEADLMVIFLRFRELPDAQMAPIVRYVESGKPIVGIRTATHAFAYSRDKSNKFGSYTWRNKEWPGGFGKQILGETWVAHHGGHGSESTRGVREAGQEEHPLLRGYVDVWGPTDVYTVRELPSDATVLLRGRVLAGMGPDAMPVAGEKNEPMMPLVWVRETPLADEKTRRVVTSTIGASTDFTSEGLRRVMVNGCFWALAMEVPERADVRIIGTYEPLPFGFGGFQKGVKPSDLALR
ncbi:MAG: ThuA domain-containing protein [bacterium]|nr:ThuA domain-containing protein [bacterium]